MSTPYIGSDRLLQLPESETLAMAQKVRELKAAGRDVISLTLGEPDFDTPTHIKNAAVEAIRANFTHYPPVAGIPELREAVAQHLKDCFQLEYTASQVIVSNGAKHSIYNALMALLNPGDEVIIPAPYWVSYLPMTVITNGVPAIVQPAPDADLKLTPEVLEAAITPKTRLLMLNNPSNPSGMVYTEAELRALAVVLEKYPDVWIMSDEIYGLLSYNEPLFSFARIPEMYNRTITINGCSKSFAMTGWRVGFLAAPKSFVDLCNKYQGQVTSGVCSIAQKAAYAALSKNLTAVYRMRDEFRKRRDAMMARMEERIPEWTMAKPEGAFYLYPNVAKTLGKTTPAGKVLASVEDLSDYLIDAAGVAIVTGSAFGTPTYLRLSYAASLDVLLQAVDQIADALAKLKD
jgi:aspartate aminotransferase